MIAPSNVAAGRQRPFMADAMPDPFNCEARIASHQSVASRSPGEPSCGSWQGSFRRRAVPGHRRRSGDLVRFPRSRFRRCPRAGRATAPPSPLNDRSSAPKLPRNESGRCAMAGAWSSSSCSPRHRAAAAHRPNSPVNRRGRIKVGIGPRVRRCLARAARLTCRSRPSTRVASRSAHRHSLLRPAGSRSSSAPVLQAAAVSRVRIASDLSSKLPRAD